jgi:flavorubredoxin
LDPRQLRHIIVPHFEGDECGALKKFLDIAPNAVPVCSPTGASSVGDFAEKDPKIVAEGEVLSIGSRRLRFILTPYVHLWDSLVVYEETQGVLYSSDLFMQPGEGPPTTDQDLSDQMVESYRLGGLMPSMRHLHSALDKLEPLLSETPGIKTVACHHGSVLTGGLTPYFKALRENDVTAAALA